ncbi:PREDICTED: transmembrane protein 234 homolog [Dinoponera quadriceps]|uniref:Transmembrane protein 234 homolog n=1 Tax=Dinoponera quadriceps TaxID=609295 RepID=A0A6P3WP07_DINQU|nr:PREDICTED: transmembrane protein 234 homolog [Dinoponera quadriceps]XP_014467578.1 PREDICTED: transmembrane protein 234 homolog [Dinoponera quadriceps]XP_014467579.1 PREDICTED: transmembrane protein 234 homolog [Dinoponera quadriceps]XP_014467581.1 PREDICTED: transmembrane protein 234 homolog [Dinoponera quadriceps]XP_014467582.1 PREDICTED: transmembrane protein 234 homolog [Dinoponera quadriceps]XP_014467583.1 PREDICTED: transmembrane protein 234 homolog [Dinoponera quadriceps]XP_01446758
MAVTIESVIYLCLVAVLWGMTNPFMKKGAGGLENVKATSIYGQFIKELVFLATNVKYMLPFVLNQCGSVLYFLILQNTDISLAVPVSNSLTFIFTAITGWFLGEQKVHKNAYIGMIFILCGTSLCCWDKLYKIME